MKKITSLMLSLMALLAMTGCSQKSALQEQVQALQNAMPLNFMEGAQVSAISLDQSLNLTIDVDEDALPLKNIEAQKGELGKALTTFFYGQKGSLKDLAQAIVESKTGLKFNFKGRTSGKTVAVEADAAEAASLLGSGSSPLTELKERVAFANIAAPVALDDYNSLGVMTIDEKQIVFPLIIDAKYYDRKLTAKEVKAYIEKNILIDENVAAYVELANKAGLSQVWNYQSSAGGTVVSATFAAK